VFLTHAVMPLYLLMYSMYSLTPFAPHGGTERLGSVQLQFMQLTQTRK
jgi:hypothetical protein